MQRAAAVLLHVDALRRAAVPGAGRLRATDADANANRYTDANGDPHADTNAPIVQLDVVQ